MPAQLGYADQDARGCSASFGSNASIGKPASGMGPGLSRPY